MTTALNPEQQHIVKLLEGGKQKAFGIARSDFTIGREEKAEIRIPSTEISSRHVAVRIQGGRVFVKDLGSKNGTWVGGKRLEPGREIALDGVPRQFRLASVVLVTIEPFEPPPESVPEPEKPAPFLKLVTPPPQPARESAPSAELSGPTPAEVLAAARTEADGLRAQALAEIEKVQAEAVRFSETLQLEAATHGENTLIQARTEAEGLVSAARDQAAAALKEIETRRDALVREAEELLRARDVARERLAEAVGAQRAEEDALRRARDTTLREREIQEAEERRRKALYDALDGEYKVKQLALEAQLVHAESRRVDGERAVQAQLARLGELEAECARLRADTERAVRAGFEKTEALEAEARKARERMDRFRQEAERLRAGMQEQEVSLGLLKQKTEEASREALAAQDALESSQAALTEFRARLDRDADSARAQLNVDLTLERQNAESRIEESTARLRRNLETELAERRQTLERELAEHRARELAAVQQLQENERRAARARHEDVIDDIVRRALELGRDGSQLAQHEPELRTVVKVALERRAAATGVMSLRGGRGLPKPLANVGHALRSAIASWLAAFKRFARRALGR